MKFIQKIIVFTVFLMGLVLIYNISFQRSSISLTVELIAEKNPTSDFTCSGFEIHEDDQGTNKMEILSAVNITSQPDQFQVIYRLSQPVNIVWQPPKIN